MALSAVRACPHAGCLAPCHPHRRDREARSVRARQGRNGKKGRHSSKH